MNKADILSWISVLIGAFGDNPIITLSLVVAILALLVAHRALGSNLSKGGQ